MSITVVRTDKDLLGTVWRRKVGKHKGACWEIVKVTNTGYRAKQVANEWSKRTHSGDGGYNQYTSISKDMLQRLYEPEKELAAVLEAIETATSRKELDLIEARLKEVAPTKAERKEKEVKVAIVTTDKQGFVQSYEKEPVEVPPTKNGHATHEDTQLPRFVRLQPYPTKHRPRITEEQERAICQLYSDQDTSVLDIGKMFGVGESTVYRTLLTYGVPTRKPAISAAITGKKRTKGNEDSPVDAPLPVLVPPEAKPVPVPVPVPDTIQGKMGATGRFRVTYLVMTEVTEEVVADTPLDALAIFDGRPGIEVVTVDKVRDKVKP